MVVRILSDEEIARAFLGPNAVVRSTPVGLCAFVQMGPAPITAEGLSRIPYWGSTALNWED